MKATLDFVPAYCPNCGSKCLPPETPETKQASADSIQDYLSGDTWVCSCGAELKSASHDFYPVMRRVIQVLESVNLSGKVCTIAPKHIDNLRKTFREYIENACI